MPIYAVYWKKYSIATGYLNAICEYLNGRIVNQRRVPGVSERRLFVGTTNYPRQDVQAVSALTTRYLFAYTGEQFILQRLRHSFAPAVLPTSNSQTLTCLFLLSSPTKSGETMSFWKSSTANTTGSSIRFLKRFVRIVRGNQSTIRSFRRRFCRLVKSTIIKKIRDHWALGSACLWEIPNCLHPPFFHLLQTFSRSELKDGSAPGTIYRGVRNTIHCPDQGILRTGEQHQTIHLFHISIHEVGYRETRPGRHPQQPLLPCNIACTGMHTKTSSFRALDQLFLFMSNDNFPHHFCWRYRLFKNARPSTFPTTGLAFRQSLRGWLPMRGQKVGDVWNLTDNTGLYFAMTTWYLTTIDGLDCNMAYALLSRIEDGITPLLWSFEKYITTVGKDIILNLGTSITKVLSLFSA